ncbi:MAG TPA: transposase [Gemmataceae bacterium]|nr:transposase [Gemmataceae bacterium]
MIFADALPRIKTFLRPARLSAATAALLVRLVAAFVCHRGRLSASQAAGAIRSQARHRAQLTRFLARQHWSRDWAVLAAVADLLLAQEAQRAGTWAFILDQTYVGQQGQQTENTFSRANYRPRAKKGNRKNKKHARRSCHGFVCGLLLTPSGLRIPCCRSYYTEGYCRAKQFPYRTQIELAATLIRQLAMPQGAEVVVLGDTAFEAQDIRAACAERGFAWVVPLNPERVLAGPKPRPKVLSLVKDWSAERFEAVRLVPGQGPDAALRRAARCRVGPQAKARTYYVHPERRAVHNIGDVLLVFSTKEKPQGQEPVKVQKVLLTNAVTWTAARVVELYDLRWQVELFFKELKGTLGFHRYRFREFVKVENWAQACLVAFCYLEWHRARQLARRDLPEQAQRWWRWQRSYGLSLAVSQASAEHDLARLYRLAGTPTGRRKLRKCLREALPREYRPAE